MDVESTMLPLGTKMPSFNLLGIDGEMYTNEIFDGKKGSLVMFICNHCPFVNHVNEEIVNLSNEIMGNDIGVIGINSNDSTQEKYAEDSIDKMREYADNLEYNFPMLLMKINLLQKILRRNVHLIFFFLTVIKILFIEANLMALGLATMCQLMGKA